MDSIQGKYVIILTSETITDSIIRTCCFALFVCLTLLASFFLPSHLFCLTLLASFFLPSHLSFKNMYRDIL